VTDGPSGRRTAPENAPFGRTGTRHLLMVTVALAGAVPRTNRLGLDRTAPRGGSSMVNCGTGLRTTIRSSCLSTPLRLTARLTRLGRPFGAIATTPDVVSPTPRGRSVSNAPVALA